MKRFQKILVLCDLHYMEDGELNAISTFEYDFCVILGDIIPEALVLIKELISKPIYAVGGNHDTREMYVKTGIPYINGELVEVNGVSIVGIEGSHRYKKTEELVMLTHEESIEIADSLAGADILISHDSSFGRYGTAANKCGLKGITKYIEEKCSMLHLHGHHHVYDRYMIGDTLCLACYRCMVVGTDGSVEKVF